MKTAAHIFLFSSCLLLSGCVTLYKPNAIHSPMLKEKGEANASAVLGFSGCGMVNLQSAYAVTNHIGIMVDGMYHSRNLEYTIDEGDGVEKLRLFFAEGGAGYFTKFGREKKGLFQCYGGGGYGSSRDKLYDIDEETPEASAKYFNVFIQPGLAYINKNIEIAFDMRANYVRMFHINAYLYDEFDWWDLDSDIQLYDDLTLDFINLEPTITFKGGSEKVKVIGQFGATIPTMNVESFLAVNAYAFLGFPLIKLTFGINYTFGKKKSIETK